VAAGAVLRPAAALNLNLGGVEDIAVFSSNWWSLALRGLAALILGVLTFAWPEISLTALVFLFGAYALVDGLFTAVAALGAPEGYGSWWALLLEGVFGVAAGILAFFWPGITALVLLYLIAAWAVVTGVFEIIAAVRLRELITGEWMLALGGVVSVLFGVLLAAWPGAGRLRANGACRRHKPSSLSLSETMTILVLFHASVKRYHS